MKVWYCDAETVSELTAVRLLPQLMMAYQQCSHPQMWRGRVFLRNIILFSKNIIFIFFVCFIGEIFFLEKIWSGEHSHVLIFLIYLCEMWRIPFS